MRQKKTLSACLMLLALFLFSSCVIYNQEAISSSRETIASSIAATEGSSLREPTSSHTEAATSESSLESVATESSGLDMSESATSGDGAAEPTTEDDATLKDPTEIADLYERLMYANLPTRALSQNENVLIRMQSKREQAYWYYTMDENSLSVDSAREDLGTGEISVYNVRGKGYYALEKNEPSFLFIPEVEPDRVGLLFGFEIFRPEEVLEYIKEDRERGLVVCRTVAMIGDTYDTVSYTYVADASTLLLKSMMIEGSGSDEEPTYVAFTYNEADVTADTTAYDLHTYAPEQIKLYLNTGSGLDVYTLASDTRIGVSSDAVGTEYALYKNQQRTKDVTDLSLQKNGEMHVYLGLWNGDVSFEYTLINEDLTEMKSLLKDFERLAIEGNDEDAVSAAYDAVIALYEYIETQASIARIHYYSDHTNAAFHQQYNNSATMYSEAYSLLRSTVATIALSDSPFKDQFFMGWTEKEIENLHEDHSVIIELQNQNNQLLMEYSELDPASPNWGERVNALYEKLVENSNKIAFEQGYENYYEYAAEYVHGRDYQKSEREAFRTYVKEYIVPLYEITDAYLRPYFGTSSSSASVSLTPEQAALLKTLLDDEMCEMEEGYARDYFSCFGDPLEEKMSSMLDKNGLVIADGAGAYTGAFTIYFPLYEEPVAYFGPGYSNLLTMIHENGHYAAFYGIGSDPLPDLDLCETHSQGNEWLFTSYLKDRMDPEVYRLFMLHRLLEGLKGIISATMVDECEEAIYAAATPYTAAQYDALIDLIAADYGSFTAAYDGKMYFKSVAVLSQVYYISYATSEMASIALYTHAEEDFDAAMIAFEALLDDADTDDRFLSSLTECGLPSPFAEDTFQSFTEIVEALIPNEALLDAA